jgi:trans-aconitate 2-methyltransferase
MKSDSLDPLGEGSPSPVCAPETGASSAGAATTGGYTFGDSALAADRLRHLAALFQPALAAFVAEHARRGLAQVIDLGSGPGHTTRALWTLLAPERLLGLDNSQRFIDEARRDSPPAIEYRLHDLRCSWPLDAGAAPRADVMYSRFLLTHLPEPRAALSLWAELLAPGGRLLLQETSHMASSHPALARYYELMAEFQRRHGQAMDIGQRLESLADDELFQRVQAGARRFELSGPRMARVHLMNLATWRRDAQAHSFAADELDRLGQSLDALARDDASDVVVEYTMGELVLERR